MIPTWMIEEIERERGERERASWDRPQLQIELPVRPAEDAPPASSPSSVIVIELGGALADP